MFCWLADVYIGGHSKNEKDNSTVEKNSVLPIQKLVLIGTGTRISFLKFGFIKPRNIANNSKNSNNDNKLSFAPLTVSHAFLYIGAWM